jgi:hypothetical protein
VDIVDEAVEICKLRLFLKLIAHAEPDASKKNHGIEPLPDIDFNILAGNTLVGYSQVDDIEHLWEQVEFGSGQVALAFDKDVERLKGLCREYGLVLQRFRDQQLDQSLTRRVTKEEACCAAELIRLELDEDLWKVYRQAGKYPDPPLKHQQDFIRSHEPFHWFLEFPLVMAAGGFDVAIGNPPYLSASRVANRYAPIGLKTEPCRDLYPWVTERCLSVLRKHGRMGLIVPLSVGTSGVMQPLRSLLADELEACYTAHFANRPCQLFIGAQNRLTILLGYTGVGLGSAAPSSSSQALPNHTRSISSKSMGTVATRYYRFYAGERPVLFQSLELTQTDHQFPAPIPKIADSTHLQVFRKVYSQAEVLGHYRARSPERCVFYQESVGYWVKASIGLPWYEKNSQVMAPQHGRYFLTTDECSLGCLFALMNSSLFFSVFMAVCDGFHLNDSFLAGFPISKMLLSNETLRDLGFSLDEALRGGASVSSMTTSLGDRIRFAVYYPSRCKEIIDQIDQELAKCYSLTDQELAAVISYDLKYRMVGDTE